MSFKQTSAELFAIYFHTCRQQWVGLNLKLGTMRQVFNHCATPAGTQQAAYTLCPWVNPISMVSHKTKQTWLINILFIFLSGKMSKRGKWWRHELENFLSDVTTWTFPPEVGSLGPEVTRIEDLMMTSQSFPVSCFSVVALLVQIVALLRQVQIL